MMHSNFAFFDVDGTLLRLKSMFSFQRFYYERNYGASAALAHATFAESIAALERAGCARSVINASFYQSFRGRDVASVAELAGQWHREISARRPSVLCEPTLAELRAHAARGTGIVFVSGSFAPLLAPLALDLGACAVLATKLEVEGGRYTGRIIAPQMIGPGKAEATREFLRAHGADAARCFAYGDHSSDLPLLELVGHPVVVGDDPELRLRAAQGGWRVLTEDRADANRTGALTEGSAAAGSRILP